MRSPFEGAPLSPASPSLSLSDTKAPLLGGGEHEALVVAPQFGFAAPSPPRSHSAASAAALSARLRLRGLRLRVWLRVWLPLVGLLVLCAALGGFGVLLSFYPEAVPTSDGGGRSNSLPLPLLLPSSAVSDVGGALLALALVLPCCCLGACVFRAIPGRGARMRSEVFADALMQDLALSSPAALAQHCTSFPAAAPPAPYSAPTQHFQTAASALSGGAASGPRGAGAGAGASGPAMLGTVLFFAGAGAPREASFVLASSLAAASLAAPPQPLGAGPAVGFSIELGALRCVCVDLPGHGSLASVAFSLGRCERVIEAVIERELRLLRSLPTPGPLAAPLPDASQAQAQGHAQVQEQAQTQALALAQARRSVVIVTYGGSAVVGLHFALRHRALVAGIACVGRVPDYLERSLSLTLQRGVLRLRWACSLADVAAKGRVLASHGLDVDKAPLLMRTFEFAVLPELIREARLLQQARQLQRPPTTPPQLLLQPQPSSPGRSGAAMLQTQATQLLSRAALRALARPVLFLGPEQDVRSARAVLGDEDSLPSLIPAPGGGGGLHAPLSFVAVRGVRDDKIASLDRAKIEPIVTALLRFARDAFALSGNDFEEQRQSQLLRQAQSQAAQAHANAHALAQAQAQAQAAAQRRRSSGSGSFSRRGRSSLGLGTGLGLGLGLGAGLGPSSGGSISGELAPSTTSGDSPQLGPGTGSGVSPLLTPSASPGGVGGARRGGSILAMGARDRTRGSSGALLRFA